MNCVGRRVVSNLLSSGVVPETVLLQNLGTGFVTHGSVAQLQRLCGLDARSLCEKADEVCKHV